MTEKNHKYTESLQILWLSSFHFSLTKMNKKSDKMDEKQQQPPVKTSKTFETSTTALNPTTILQLVPKPSGGLKLDYKLLNGAIQNQSRNLKCFPPIKKQLNKHLSSSKKQSVSPRSKTLFGPQLRSHGLHCRSSATASTSVEEVARFFFFVSQRKKTEKNQREKRRSSFHFFPKNRQG